MDVLTKEERVAYDRALKFNQDEDVPQPFDGDVAMMHDTIDRLVAEVERLGRIIDDSFGYLPPVGSMAFSDRMLTPHAVAVADEFAVISRQLEAFRSSEVELSARNEALEQVAKAAATFCEWDLSVRHQRCLECRHLPPDAHVLAADADALTAALSALNPSDPNSSGGET